MTNASSAGKPPIVMGVISFLMVVGVFSQPAQAVEPLWRVELADATFVYYAPQSVGEIPQMGIALNGSAEVLHPILAPNEVKFVGGYTRLQWKDVDGRLQDMQIDQHGQYRVSLGQKTYAGYVTRCGEILK